MRAELSVLSVLVLIAGCAVQTPIETTDVAAVPVDLGPNPCEGINPASSYPPRYPRKALMNGVEGEVTARFDVAENGRPLNLEVAHAEPAGVFDRGLLDAMTLWRFPADVAGTKACRYTVYMRIDRG